MREANYDWLVLKTLLAKDTADMSIPFLNKSYQLQTKKQQM